MAYKRKRTQITRNRMSVAHRGSKNGMYGRHHSATTKKRISEALKKAWKKM